MGYTTEFVGEINFNRELKGSEIAFIKELFEFDPREGNHAQSSPFEFYYIDLEFNKDFSGIKWNGAEKSYGMTEQVQWVIDRTLEKFPDLIFSGSFMAQGEEYDDRWKLTVENNKAREEKIVLKGKKVTCPHCEETFILEETE